MSREAFEAWCVLKSDCDYREGAWDAWQACEAQHEKELAALQARVRELEEVCIKAESTFITQIGVNYNNQCHETVLALRRVLSTSPDQALQRALLDARIDEHEEYGEYGNCLYRLEELRAKRAELGD